MMKNSAFYVLMLSLISSISHAEEVQMRAKGITVFGQSELPKVLYVVPWKPKEIPEIEAPETASLVTDVLTPVDPKIFKRQVTYYKLMTQSVSKEE